MRGSQIQQSNKISCTECGENHILRDNVTGELVCQSCGIVFSSINLSTNPEWRAFDPKQREKLTRVGAPTNWTIHDKGLSTNLGWQNQDFSGKQLSSEMRSKVYRLRKWQRRSMISDTKNRNLSQALIEMSKIQSKLNLPRNVIETSSLIYRKALNANMIRGRSIESIAVASIYLACRQCGIIRSLEDVAGSCNISKKNVARNYRFLLRELKPNVPQVDSQDYIGKIVSNLGLIGDTERLAKTILHRASMMKLTVGRGPAGMAAASVYISTRITGDHRTQGAIAVEAQVTEVTIRNRYKELLGCLYFEFQL
jgi:transcription initiation factor TFIIB